MGASDSRIVMLVTEKMIKKEVMMGEVVLAVMIILVSLGEADVFSRTDMLYCYIVILGQTYDINILHMHAKVSIFSLRKTFVPWSAAKINTSYLYTITSYICFHQRESLKLCNSLKHFISIRNNQIDQPTVQY